MEPTAKERKGTGTEMGKKRKGTREVESNGDRGKEAEARRKKKGEGKEGTLPNSYLN